MTSELDAAIRDALGELADAGLGIEAVFGERSTLTESLTPAAAYAAGIVDGAGIALGLTALEVLDELGLLPAS
jgi:hypothetical protein